jgi:hypothetical protein
MRMPTVAAQLSPAEELAAIEIELKRRHYLANPTDWVANELHEHLWSTQRRIMDSVRDNRRTAVPSCHEAGKSFLAARIAAWWLAVHLPGEAFVVTSAPTGRQVRNILWREIGRAHGLAKLPGRTNQTEWFMVNPLSQKEEIVAFGMKPDDMDPTAFQGIHARYVLVIFDEACGIVGNLWEAADSLIANDESRFLAIGNPDDSETEFHEVCKPGSSWNVIPIDAYETPNFTSEPIPERLRPLLIGQLWVEEKKRKWGETNPMYLSKVRGQFPDVSIDGLIPMKWIRAAQLAELKPTASDPNELGVDVGGGGNKSIICHRNGPVYRIIRRDQTPDTMETCGNVIAALKQTGATSAKVDEIGIGRGVVNRGQELKHPIIGINVGRSAMGLIPNGKGKFDPDEAKKAFVNLRSEGYWLLRDRFQQNEIDIDPDDEDLAAQLVDLKYKRNSKGQIVMESKDDIKRRGKPSPDDADAVMLANIPAKAKKKKATWGSGSGSRAA